MSTNINLSLDDIIKQRKTTAPKGKKGTGVTRNFGGPGRGPKKAVGGQGIAGGPRPVYRKKYVPPVQARKTQQHAQATQSSAGQLTARRPKGPRQRSIGISRKPYMTRRNQAVTKQVKTAGKDNVLNRVQARGLRRLKVTNLHEKVTNSDIHTLFSTVGELKKCGIHWNSLGASLGVATVEFINPGDAEEAIKKYNGVYFDNRMLKVEFDKVGSVPKVKRGGGITRDRETQGRPARSVGAPRESRSFEVRRRGGPRRGGSSRGGRGFGSRGGFRGSRRGGY